MKKFITFSLVVLLTIILFSCKKESLTKPVTAANTVSSSVSNNGGSIVTDPPVSTPYILSNWFSMQMLPVNLGQGNNYLSGQVIFNNQLPDNDDVKLAFIKSAAINDVNSFTVRQLPIDVHTNTGNVHLWFNLRAYDSGSTAFALYAENENQNIMPDPRDFIYNHYRYLVVPKTTYLTLQVDWTNYQAVAIALNFTP